MKKEKENENEVSEERMGTAFIIDSYTVEYYIIFNNFFLGIWIKSRLGIAACGISRLFPKIVL